MITYFKGYLPHSYLAHLVVVRINESICAKLLQQCLGVCVCAPSHPYMRVHVHISHLTNANYLYICLYSWLLLASRTNWLDLMEGKHEPTPLPSCHRFQRRHTKSSFKRIFFSQSLLLAAVVVHWLSQIWFFVIQWTAASQAYLSFTISWSLLKLRSIELVMPSSHLILCHPLLLLPSIFPSIGVFSNEQALHISWPKFWSFTFSIHPSREYSGLISFRVDRLHLFAVLGTLKSFLQDDSSKALVLWCSAFFTVQLSHPYMTTGKGIALTRWTFVSKVMSLLFNMLSRLVIAFLPRSKHLLVSWL